LLIGHLNVQCLRTKLESLEIFIEDEQLDILSVSEHWLEKEEVQYYLNVGKLVLASSYCRDSMKNGGSALYINKCLSFDVVDVERFCVQRSCEIVAIHLSEYDLIIVSVYRSPFHVLSDDFCDNFERCMLHLISISKNLIVCGDFNVDVTSCSSEVRTFEHLVKQCGLFITNTTPTRGDACLDNVLTSLPRGIYSTKVVIPLISDHDALVMEVSMPSVSTNSVYPWFAEYNFFSRPSLSQPEALLLFKERLQAVRWDALLDAHETCAWFGVFFSRLQTIFEECFPLKVRRGKRAVSRPDPPKRAKEWYTPELARLRNQMLACREWNDIPGYQALKKRYNRELEVAKRAANVRFIESAHNKCKAAWSVVNGEMVRNEKMVCPASPDEFNSFFLSSVEEIISSVPDTDTDPVVVTRRRTSELQCSLSGWKRVSVEHIIKVINNFKGSVSRDCYGWSTLILKEVADIIAPVLTRVVNGCLETGRFPDQLKRARTVPIYKKGDRTSVESFRPISILPVLSKVLETVMREQVYSYFENNNLLSGSQHGFRTGRSTASAVEILSREVRSAFEDGESVALTLCDLSRAFDCVAHDVLLKKLECYGVSGSVLELFRDYLRNRTQSVSLAGADSREMPVPHGVPQGSVLGPFLFLVLINDLDEDRAAVLFADDTTLLSRGANCTEAGMAATDHLRGARDWFCSNRLQMNETKTQQLLCTLSRTPVEDNEPVKLLGFQLDSRLSWNDHASLVCSRLARVNFLLRRLRKSVTEPYLLMVYHAMFHAHIGYGVHLWGHAAEVAEVLKLQKAALRIVTGSGFRAHCKPIFVRLRVLTVCSHYIFACLTQIRSSLHLLPTRSDVHQHNTRNRGQLNVPWTRLAGTQKSYPASAMRFYNKLPDEVRGLDDRKFRRAVKEMLLERPYYRVDEFFEDTLGWGEVM
jgi:hypothetical protein